MNGIETRFKIGNQAAEKWNEEEVEKVMFKMLTNAHSDDEILSLQDAILSVELYSSSLNYLVNKFPVFKNIKNDINDVIIARLNKGGLKGDFNPTIVVWRSKQLGEKDTQYQEVKSDVKQTNVIKLGKGEEPK